MSKSVRFYLLFGAVFLVSQPLFGISSESISHEERAKRAGAVARGTVESISSFRGSEGKIHTEAVIRTNEVFKGRFPARLAFRYRGGFVDGAGASVTDAPNLEVGDERLFFLSLKSDGSLSVEGGPTGAPLVDTAEKKGGQTSAGVRGLERMRQLFPQPVEGLTLEQFAAGDEETSLREQSGSAVASVTATGLLAPPRRFVTTDRGEPIPYLVDADDLPPGITVSQALEAVENALDAWAEVSSVTFVFEGTQVFGAAADDISEDDGRLRIQLHDSYGAIGGSSTLGIGGQFYRSAPEFEDGGGGGAVDGLEFHRTTGGFVVLKHTATSMQNLDTFEAVVCHEIGHSLGLAHSSEDPDEGDPYLKDAIMYFQVQGNQSGAVLDAWDVDTVETTHPEETPPFGFDRVLRVVTSHNPLANPEVNQVTLPGYSLHAEALAVDLYAPTANNGAFSLSGSVLTFTPDGAFSDSQEFDPGGGQAYDRTYARFDDGINLSPPFEVRVIQLLLDTEPSGGADGLPDSWAEEHFGSSAPVAGVSGAADDPDGDRLTNLQEFLFGTDPRDANSRFTVTNITSSAIEFQARPYEVYELYQSPDLVNWNRTRIPVQPHSSAGEFAEPSLEGSQGFFRVERVW